MAKWSGKIGFAKTSETSPGIWEESIIARTYRGDLFRNSRRLRSNDSINNDLIISNEISVVADPFAKENFHSIRYAEYMGTKWTVTNIESQYPYPPRLVLTLGEVYNG